jgi:quercetin dioxygenase-like cupin family protein
MPTSGKMARMRVLLVVSLLVASAVAAVLGTNEPSAGAQGERRVVAESKFSVTDPALQSEVVLLVVDFPPGAWTSLHTHGGQAINLVLEGEITLRHGGMERPHTAGQAWTDSTGQVHAAGNTGRGKARLLTNFLLPRGAPQITVVQDSPFEPTIAYEARFPVPALPAEAEIVQQLAELSSGRRDEQASVGFTAGIVVAGEITYTLGGERKDYTPGESWSAPAGTLVTEENRAAGKARVFTTYLLPRRIGK